VYALGKVLYEISTGKDRNAFPDLPASARGLSGREKLMQLNPLLLRACASDDVDRFKSAGDFANALRRLNAPSAFAGPFSWRERRLIAIAAALASLLVLSDALLIYLGTRQPTEQTITSTPPAAEMPLQGKYDSGD
jgi:hypothetical protein